MTLTVSVEVSSKETVVSRFQQVVNDIEEIRIADILEIDCYKALSMIRDGLTYVHQCGDAIITIE